jgi:AcrR family transcriptional regulator
VRRRGPGRRAGSTGETRAAILGAARALFAARGFRGATMRAVAQRAGVDLALVSHFFGSKAGLFAAAIELPVSGERLRERMACGRGGPGERLLRFHLEELFVARREGILALLRAALGDPESIPTLRRKIEEELVAGAARAIEGPEARLRAELAGAVMVGLFVCRHMVRVEPLARAPAGRLVRLLSPLLDGILAGGVEWGEEA